MIRVHSPGGEGIAIDFAPGRVLVSIRGWQIWYPSDKCRMSYRHWKVLVNFRGCLGMICPQKKLTFWTITPQTPQQCQDFIDRYCAHTAFIQCYPENEPLQISERKSPTTFSCKSDRLQQMQTGARSLT